MKKLTSLFLVMSLLFSTASYDYNRGQNPRQIAYNAQMAEANS